MDLDDDERAELNELKAKIAELLLLADGLQEGSAKHKFVVRQLRGLCRTREHATGMVEDLDHFGSWRDIQVSSS